ncbi:MAG TPA: DNA primase, partial [Gammaproteobacteria bacterium]|nr:DNA primase [Gammaproteobacteria bacterium]
MAGLIPQQFIDDLLTRIDIIDVIDGYVPLRKAGRNHIARCPFHDEKTPSFTVSQEKQFYHCFGCGANGTAIGFLMEYAGMDFVEAVEELAGRAGLEVPREGGQPSRDSGVTELYELMEMVVRYYCRQLREHPEAQRAVDYLKERGLTGQLARDFELGFAPAGWDNLVNELGGSDAALQRLAKTGMIIQRENGGYYDRFRDRIMFPIRDQRGRAIGMGGRVLGDGTPKYLNSPETPIFHKGRELYGLYQVRHKQKSIEQLFVVEGYMDVLALSQHGIGNCVATLGTAVTQDHMERLFKVCNLI